MLKIPGSQHLHTFNVRVPECGSLGTRLRNLSILLLALPIAYM